MNRPTHMRSSDLSFDAKWQSTGGCTDALAANDLPFQLCVLSRPVHGMEFLLEVSRASHLESDQGSTSRRPAIGSLNPKSFPFKEILYEGSESTSAGRLTLRCGEIKMEISRGLLRGGVIGLSEGLASRCPSSNSAISGRPTVLH